MISRPNKTLADYFAIAISPALIMALVGSLCFFLVEVFYRGEAIGSVRWVLFWFVLATVLVARLGIEQGTTYAAIYGIALAVATWLYLTHVQPAPLLGAILLGIVWWCAHKLTWDCTLIDDDQDASGKGLFQTAFKKEQREAASNKPPKLKPPGLFFGNKKALHPPGVWLVYFSLAALPLFGIGQMLLPAGDLDAPRTGFHYLFVYLCAAIGLLLTTSFLGLRRYLRQRYLPMPANVALGWIKFGASVAATVLLVALLVPRPGGSDSWVSLRYHIDYQSHRASRYAMRFNPHGPGKPDNNNPSDTSQSPDPQSKSGQQQSDSGLKTPNKPGDQSGQNHSPSGKVPPPLSTPAAHLYQLLKWLLLFAGTALIAWWMFRHREILLQMWREFWAALVQFFRNLFGFRLKLPGAKTKQELPKPRLYSEYQNPFLHGQDTTLTPQQLILYSYEALQCWAGEQGIKTGPEQTARELCNELSKNFPEMTPELNHLAFVHGHASYGTSIPSRYRPELLQQLWDYMSTTRLQPAQAA
jgi:hypothetical protein